MKKNCRPHSIKTPNKRKKINAPMFPFFESFIDGARHVILL